MGRQQGLIRAWQAEQRSAEGIVLLTKLHAALHNISPLPFSGNPLPWMKPEVPEMVGAPALPAWFRPDEAGLPGRALSPGRTGNTF